MPIGVVGDVSTVGVVGDVLTVGIAGDVPTVGIAVGEPVRQQDATSKYTIGGKMLTGGL